MGGKEGTGGPATWATWQLSTQQQEPLLFSPGSAAAPGCAPQGIVPSGSPRPAPGTAGGPEGCSEGAAGTTVTSSSALTLLHQPLPGLGCLPPSTLLPLGCISAHPSAVIPAGCAEKGKRSRLRSLFELQLGKAPGYPPAQPEMLTYAYRRGSREVPASGGTLLRGRSLKDPPASRSEPERGSALCPQPLFNPYIPYKPPTSTAKPATRITPPTPNLLSGEGPGKEMVAGASLSLTSLHAQHRGQHGEQERLHGADDVAGEMRRATRAARGWRQGRAPGVGKGR